MNVFRDQHPADAMVLSLAKCGRTFRLSEHFVLAELASGDGADEVLVHPALVLLLEQVRRHFDAPVVINSGYRTPKHNKRVGGAKSSIHMLGMAADVVVRGATPHEVQHYAGTLGIGGLGKYPTFTHCDVFGRGRRF